MPLTRAPLLWGKHVLRAMSMRVQTEGRTGQEVPVSALEAILTAGFSLFRRRGIQAEDRPADTRTGGVPQPNKGAQALEDVLQQELRADVVGHAVRSQQNHGRVRTRRVQDTAERPIDCAVDVSERIADPCGHTWIVVGMLRVVEVPALMAGAMSLSEDLNEDVPLFPSQEFQSQIPFFVPRSDPGQRPRKAVESSISSTSGAGCFESVPHSPQPSGCMYKTRRRRATPFNQLDPIQRRGRRDERHVQHGYPLARSAQPVPKRLGRTPTKTEISEPGQNPEIVVRARDQLRPVVEAMAGGIRARIEGRPGGTLVEPVDAHDVAHHTRRKE
jgi:hypothetical protein